MEWGLFRRVWHGLTRTDVAALFIVILLLVVALGSCFPQLPPAVGAEAARLARWETAARARYGALTDLLTAAGAFRLFQSPLFLLPLALLSMATLVCTLNRWRQALRKRSALLVSLVEHLAVLLLLLGALLSSAFGWREELTLAPGAQAEVGHARQVALRNEGFRIARYRDGSAAGYAAQVVVVAKGQEMTCYIRLNEPLEEHGIGVYLYGYGQTERGYNVTLLAVHDPGYGVVIAAGFLLLLAMMVRLSQAFAAGTGTVLAKPRKANACEMMK